MNMVSPRRAERWIRALTGPLRPWVLVAIAVATGALVWPASRVGIEHDNASLIAEDSKQLDRYESFRRAFGNDEDLLVAMMHPRLLSGTGLRVLDAISQEIAGIDGVRRVWSLTTAEVVAPGRFGAEPVPLIAPPFDTADGEARAERAIAAHPELARWLISADRRTAGIIVEIEERPGNADYRQALIGALRAIGAREAAAGTSFHLTGVPVQKHDVSAAIARDQRLLMPLAVAVSALTLWAFFGSLGGVLIPLGVAGAAVLWTAGLYGATGHDWNAITSLLPPTLLVVALAATVHVYEAWCLAPNGRAKGRDDSIRAVATVAMPVCLCALTTAQGFGSLAFGDVPAVRQFGSFAAMGVVAALILGLAGAPAVLSLLRTPERSVTRLHRRTTTLLADCSRFATLHPVAVAAGFLFVTLVSLAALPGLRSNTDLVGFLRAKTELRVDTEIVERELGGALALEMVIERVDRGPVAMRDALGKLANLERRIRHHDEVISTNSGVVLVREVYRAEHPGAVHSWRDDEAGFLAAVDLLEESGHPLWRRYVSVDQRSLRLTLRIATTGSDDGLRLVGDVRAAARSMLGPDLVLMPTGALYQVMHDSERIVAAQVKSFGVAICLVVLTIGALFRSLSWTLLALVPNVMPIVWTGALMSFLGIDLSTGTAMIASAVLGLVVDDTIHYLATYRRVYAGEAVAAVRETTRIVGGPVGVASVSLVLGFWIGAFGSFVPTAYFSILTGVTMIVGLACDVLLLPALLVLIDRGGSVDAMERPGRRG